MREYKVRVSQKLSKGHQNAEIAEKVAKILQGAIAVCVVRGQSSEERMVIDVKAPTLEWAESAVSQIMMIDQTYVRAEVKRA